MQDERGYSLIEEAISIALVGIIAVGFLSGLGYASIALATADERSTAESLARSEVEYVKNQFYIVAANYDSEISESGEVTYEKISGIPEGYTIYSINRDGDIVEDIIGVPWDTINSNPIENDEGIQRIKLIVKHHDKQVITVEDFKVAQ
jgi:type II secretory pathway pseudopilin PulG